MKSLKIAKEQLMFPFDNDIVMRKQKSLKRTLLEQKFNFEKRIAILSGYTTTDIKNILELFLLAVDIKPVFYESEYNKYYEESVFANQKLINFRPEIIVVQTSFLNLMYLPEIGDPEEAIENKLTNEFTRYEVVWKNLSEKYHCVIVQNNFELPYIRSLGNLDCSNAIGHTNYVMRLNQKIAEYAQSHRQFYVHDIFSLSAQIGLDQWYDRSFYYAYKFAFSYDVIPKVAYNLSNVVKSILGISKKCLILDLDNTLWGGVIGDDGLNGIEIGKETPQAEAFTEFQQYVLRLKKRGIILAVCSKNDMENAKMGFTHPDSILSVADFAVFKANWQPKHLNIVEIAQELNIGLDSMVFIDDNPVERQIVKENLPEVVVPEVDANDVSSYMRIIDRAGYFEAAVISDEDLIRNRAYEENAKRKQVEKVFVSYDEFLKSLEMEAEIKPFVPIYFERITQLTNKSNQFNLTTKRYTLAEIGQIANNSRYITLYGRLKDKFGDNGLVSVIIGEIKDEELHIDLWLMSCRVLKRGMENAMFDCLMLATQNRNIKKIIGYYYQTEKNRMVSDLYKNFGFKLSKENKGNTVWEYECQNKKEWLDCFIEIKSTCEG